jgi:hypothetical protein
MSQHQTNTTCSLIPAIDGDIQVVIGSTGIIVLDVQGAHRDVFGDLVHDHGTVRLTYDAVCELRALLDQIDEPADDRQPALPAIWSEASFTQPIRHRRRAA